MGSLALAGKVVVVTGASAGVGRATARVNVGSALAYRAIRRQAAYCGAKHGLRGFTDSLRCELMNERSGVRATMVHLPGLNTPQFTWVRVRGLPHTPRPVAPVYQPEICAEAIVWAATHRRRDDLFEPVQEDRGVHGPFGDEAKSRSWQWRATKHRRVLLGAAGAVTADAAATALGRR